jgi:hypothetical protein
VCEYLNCINIQRQIFEKKFHVGGEDCALVMKNYVGRVMKLSRAVYF